MLSRSEKKLLQAALRSANTDQLRIFPAKPNAKTPAIAKWPERATTNSETLTRLWELEDFNPAVACGFTKRIVINGVEVDVYLVVVDYDMKPGQLGAKALAQHTLFGLADTRTIKTPNGIHKYYWSLRPIPNSQSRIAPNVDVRGVRGYVIGEGAIIEGVEYHRVGEFDEIAFMPAELETAAAKGDPAQQQNESTNNKQPIGELDRPEAIETVKRWIINHAPEAIEGSGGDQATYRVAAHIKDLGISEEKCLDLMFDNWNEQKAVPPWAYDALRTKVRNAYAYGQNAPGAASALNEFDVENSGDEQPTAAQQPKDDKDDPSTFSKHVREPMLDESFDEAADTALDNQSNPLIHGIMGQGEISAIYGYPESGKSFAALDICHAIATGTPWNGRKVTQGAVLYVAAEGGPTIRKRFRALRTKHGKTNVPMRLLRYAIDMRTGTYDAKRLCELIKQRGEEMGQPIRLVVIDTLSEALAGGTDVEHMNLFIHNAKIVKNTTGANVLVIHHPGKDASKGPRGSSAFRGWVDTLIEVHDPGQGKKGSRRSFKVLRVRDGELPSSPLWFRLEVVNLGKTPEGLDVTSAVAVWCDDAKEEFSEEMTPSEKALAETISRWAKAKDVEVHTVGAKGLLVWLKANEPDNLLAAVKDVAMRKAISRLRQQGYLQNNPDNSEDEDD